jgi:hypothetical protein
MNVFDSANLFHRFDTRDDAMKGSDGNYTSSGMFLVEVQL